MTPKVFEGEAGYLELLSEVLRLGKTYPDRTNVGECIKRFNQTIWFDLRKSHPVSTVRPMSLRYGFEELMLFLRGDTDTKKLEEKGINFWKGHTSREFLDSRGLYNLPEGSLGKSYSYQYRGLGEGYIDQFSKVIEGLQNDPYSRRHLIDIWAPNDHSEMPLTSCWKSFQFNVEKGVGRDTLHLTCEVRSADLVYGTPSNYQQFAFLLKAVAKLVNMEAGTLCCNLNDCHVYSNQIQYAEELVRRDLPLCKVTLRINKDLNTLEDLLSLQWEDLELEGLVVNTKPFVTDKPKMAV